MPHKSKSKTIESKKKFKNITGCGKLLDILFFQVSRLCGGRGGLMVSALDSGSNGPD